MLSPLLTATFTVLPKVGSTVFHCCSICEICCIALLLLLAANCCSMATLKQAEVCRCWKAESNSAAAAVQRHCFARLHLPCIVWYITCVHCSSRQHFVQAGAKFYAGIPPDEEEAAAPVPNVMDNSGALSSGGPDPASRGVVKMPDSESLRRSMVAENERQAAAAQAGMSGQAVPVPATSSGDCSACVQTVCSRLIQWQASLADDCS